MRLWTAAALGAFFLFFYRLDGLGLIGPDEPRYAAVARAMADSGDWVTPRLWGEPWFEKPALLYWMTAAAFRLGLGPELGPRLPVACLSVAFLGFFYWRLRTEFGAPAAAYAAAVLATSAGWVGYSHAAVFDIPLAATFGAAMLLLMTGRAGIACGALLGASMLAKGLAGPALAGLTLAVCGRQALREALRPAAAAGFAAAAGPWYLWCALRNGRPFLEEFFWKHHVQRFAAGALEHNQPVWFFLPVLAAGLLPWTPLYGAVRVSADRRCRFLLTWAAVTLVFFSLSRDKLPGYILPALPPLAALAGVTLAGRDKPLGGWLAACGALLGLAPVAVAVLPEALNTGLGRALGQIRPPVSALAGGGALALGVWLAERRGRRTLAVALLCAASAAGYVWIKDAAFDAIDRRAGARRLWVEAEPHRSEVCLGSLRRSLAYGLQYYAGGPLPECTAQPRRYRVEESGVVLWLER